MLPGRYTVRVIAGSEVVSKTVEVIPDPMNPLTVVEHEERWSFLYRTGTLYRRALALEEEVGDLLPRIEVSLAAARNDESAPADLVTELAAMEAIVSRSGRDGGRTVRAGASRIMGHFSGSAVRMGTFGGPTVVHLEQLTGLENSLQDAFDELYDACENAIPALDRRLRQAGLPTILREG